MADTASGRLAEAFNIAWEFLRPAVENALTVQSFVPYGIGRQIRQGDRNRLRIANRAYQGIRGQS